MGHQRAGPKKELLGHRGDKPERHQRIDVGAVLRLEQVRMEHQVIAHPDRIEAVAFGRPRPPNQPLARGVLAEVRQEQPVAPSTSSVRHHRMISVAWARSDSGKVRPRD